MIYKLHRTCYSLLKKHYTVEFYNENDHYIILSFYHLNSVYNGLCYICKNSGQTWIDFQYHRRNKIVHKQLLTLSKNIYNVYKKYNLGAAEQVINFYKPLANEIYKNNYSISGGKTA